MTPRDSITQAAKAGFSAKDIATVLGRHRSTVHLWLKHGLPDKLDVWTYEQLQSLVRALELGYERKFLPLPPRTNIDKVNALKTLMNYRGAE